MSKVLLICPQPYLEWRGTPLRIGFDARALAELGNEVHLLTLPLGAVAPIPGVRTIRVWNLFGIRKLAIGPSIPKLAFDAIIAVVACGLALRHRYAVMHGIEDGGIIAVLLGRLFGCRTVYEVHSDPASYSGGWVKRTILAVYRRVQRFCLRHAHAAIGTGPMLARQVQALVPELPVHEIPDIPSSLAVASPAKTAAVRDRLRQAPNEVIATYVGSFAEYQGIDLMFAAIPVAARGDSRLRFVIVGGTSAQIAERTADLTREGVAGQVTFLAPIPPDELPDYLAASDILLSPRREGHNTPLKLLDYLKAGAAIVATNTEANLQILSDETAALAAPEPAAFAAAILRLAGDAALRRRLAGAGAAIVQTRHSYEAFRAALKRCHADALRPV